MGADNKGRLVGHLSRNIVGQGGDLGITSAARESWTISQGTACGTATGTSLSYFDNGALAV